MKVLIVEGYLRERGNTAALTDAVVSALRAKEHSVDIAGLRERTIADCLNCGRCTDTGDCPVTDDMHPLYEKVLAADALVLTSPIYMWGVTAMLKAFIDRLYSVTEKLSGKKLGLVLTAGGDAFDGLHLAVTSMKYFAEYAGMEMADTVYRAPAGESESWDAQALAQDADAFVDRLTAAQ